MLGTCIYVQVAKYLGTKTILGEHTPYGSPYEFGRPLGEDLLGRCETLSAGISGVARVNAVGHLLAAQADFLCVDDDDVVTAIHVGSEAGFGLATKDKSHAGGQTTKCEICRVNDDPLFVHSALVQGNCFVALCVHCLDL